MAARRKVDEVELGDVRVTSEALAFEASEDLLPDVMQIVSGVWDSAAPVIASIGVTNLKDMKSADVAKLVPLLGAFGAQIGGGKLRRMSPRILAGTSVVMPDPANPAEKIKLDLVKQEDRAACFDARPDLYFPCLFIAGRTTFARFFPGSGLFAKKAPPPTE